MVESIYEAIEEGSLEEVEKFLDLNYDFVEDGGWNPLHAACRVGNIAVVESILKYIKNASYPGFNINSDFETNSSNTDNRGTALTEALLHGHVDVANLLISNGADVNSAYYNQDQDCPEWFFGHYNLATNGGVAWWLTDGELFDLCLSHGLEIDATDYDDNPALIYSIGSSNYLKAKQLLENGADPNGYFDFEYMGNIPILIYAVVIFLHAKTEEAFAVVETLLRHGAPLSAKCIDCDNETVIDIVLDRNQKDLIELWFITI